MTGPEVEVPTDSGPCSVCAQHVEFIDTGGRSIRENYACPECGATLRYRHQAAVLVRLYGSGALRSIAELARSDALRGLDVYEPGIVGPLREALSLGAASYEQSYLWPDVPLGAEQNGIRCENLEVLTFPDESFDLVISSDIFEHVRRPMEGFREVRRVLKPGGRHVFTIPIRWPPTEPTRQRVDTSGPTDVHLEEPHYHGSPVDPDGSLVYTDFGMDLVEELDRSGYETTVYYGLKYNVTFSAARS